MCWHPLWAYGRMACGPYAMQAFLSNACCWDACRRESNDRRWQKRRLNRAAKHHQMSVLREALQAWTSYCEARRWKLSRSAMAKGHFSLHIFQRVFPAWRAEIGNKHQMRAKSNRALRFWILRTKLRALRRLRMWASTCLDLARRNAAKEAHEFVWQQVHLMRWIRAHWLLFYSLYRYMSRVTLVSMYSRRMRPRSMRSTWAGLHCWAWCSHTPHRYSLSHLPGFTCPQAAGDGSSGRNVASAPDSLESQATSGHLASTSVCLLGTLRVVPVEQGTVHCAVTVDALQRIWDEILQPLARSKGIAPEALTTEQVVALWVKPLTAAHGSVRMAELRGGQSGLSDADVGVPHYFVSG